MPFTGDYDNDDYDRRIAETSALQDADYRQLIDALESRNGLFATSNIGLRPTDFTPKVSDIPSFASTGMDPVNFLGTYYNTPSYGQDWSGLLQGLGLVGGG